MYVSCSLCSVVWRLAIARLCLSRNVVWGFWVSLGGVGYAMRGKLVKVLVPLMTMLLGASCIWIG